MCPLQDVSPPGCVPSSPRCPWRTHSSAAHSRTIAHRVTVGALRAGGRISSSPGPPNGASSGTTCSLTDAPKIKDGALGGGRGVPSSLRYPKSAGNGAVRSRTAVPNTTNVQPGGGATPPLPAAYSAAASSASMRLAQDSAPSGACGAKALGCVSGMCSLPSSAPQISPDGCPRTRQPVRPLPWRRCGMRQLFRGVGGGSRPPASPMPLEGPP